MSVQHKEDSIRNLRLVRLGITPPEDWTDVAQVRATKKRKWGLPVPRRSTPESTWPESITV